MSNMSTWLISGKGLQGSKDKIALNKFAFVGIFRPCFSTRYLKEVPLRFYTCPPTLDSYWSVGVGPGWSIRLGDVLTGHYFR